MRIGVSYLFPDPDPDPVPDPDLMNARGYAT
jgi:hypothetical protein